MLHFQCEKIQATIKKQLLNRFRDHIVEGQVYRMAYFTVVSNHGSYRATSHEFKLVFLHQTTVVAVDEDVISNTCFNMFPFSDLLNMTQDYGFLVDVIGLLTSVGEEKEYAKEEKILKIIVLKLTSKDLTMRCALFGDYVNQVNHFLASGYVEQPVVVIQLAKVKFFRDQVGLQNVMYATQMLFNLDLSEVVEFRGRFKIKITLEDHSGEDIFVLFDREASYLFKKSCADLFTEVKKRCKFLIDFLAEKQPDVSGGIEVAALINDKNRKAEKTPENDTLSDDFSSELDILLSSPVKETHEVFSQVLNTCSHYGENVIHEDHVVIFKGKRNLNSQFDEAANDVNRRGSKIAKVDGV
ncbi:hypothetical protein Ahy_A09g043587 [Arachis hypogaea]|uniref:Replication protein A 70 kDa DNA-binding subunit B/D first OB fold domain-containing protein n=1 Tax=Arachis hypogaea TaxID=3818 RepID=A0A445BIM7_ARAHY|nr:hypothetical protein Ahy_A09g043587 [Arachis hypogaea]